LLRPKINSLLVRGIGVSHAIEKINEMAIHKTLKL
jgi:hypothetical protein